jgi:hypothetical protein
MTTAIELIEQFKAYDAAARSIVKESKIRISLILNQYSMKEKQMPHGTIPYVIQWLTPLVGKQTLKHELNVPPHAQQYMKLETTDMTFDARIMFDVISPYGDCSPSGRMIPSHEGHCVLNKNTPSTLMIRDLNGAGEWLVKMTFDGSRGGGILSHVEFEHDSDQHQEITEALLELGAKRTLSELAQMVHHPKVH